jgi:hypothetical protein
MNQNNVNALQGALAASGTQCDTKQGVIAVANMLAQIGVYVTKAGEPGPAGWTQVAVVQNFALWYGGSMDQYMQRINQIKPNVQQACGKGLK